MEKQIRVNASDSCGTHYTPNAIGTEPRSEHDKNEGIQQTMTKILSVLKVDRIHKHAKL